MGAFASRLHEAAVLTEHELVVPFGRGREGVKITGGHSMPGCRPFPLAEAVPDRREGMRVLQAQQCV